jgi:hypothetical protein
MSVQEQGVYWPFKSFLSGSGIVLTEDATSIRIATTGPGPGGGDMLSSVFATNGQPGVVDKALTVVGTISHATLADQVPWTGITGAPTVFPTDWSVISNKPATFVPSPHALTHYSGNDLIPLATTSLPGLTGALSGQSTDYKGGDGAWHDLNTAVGANPLTMNAALTATVASSFANVTINGTLAGNDDATFSGGVTIQSSGLQFNDVGWTINSPSGAYFGIVGTGAKNAVMYMANGSTWNNDSLLIYKSQNHQNLTVEYINAAGTATYSADLVNTWNPTGTYSFRAGTHLVGSQNVPGTNTGWASAPFIAQSATNGGYGAIGMVCQNYWGFAFGAYTNGVWVATSANTFVQWSNTAGQIIGSALAPALTYNQPWGDQLTLTSNGAYAGLKMIQGNGYNVDFWVDNVGHVWLRRNNDGKSVALL